MEASSELPSNLVRRSARARKSIERFAPLLPDVPSLPASTLNVEPVTMIAGACRQPKRQLSVGASSNVVKRRKASRSLTQVNSEDAAGSNANVVEDENPPVAADGMTSSSLIPAQLSTNAPSNGVPRGNASLNDSAPSTNVQQNAQPTSPPDLRSEPCGNPLVHAESRQALCETLPYYRAFQSSAYTHDGLVHAFLLSKDTSGMGYIDDEIVIMRASGNCGQDGTGRMVQISDQKANAANVKSFRQSKDDLVAVVGIASKQCEDFPVELPHEFCVLDYFQITDIWSALSNGKKCFLYRLEKIHRETKSWWAAQGSPDRPLPPVFPQQAVRMSCNDCNEESPKVYEAGWMCLNAACTKFWFFNGRKASERLRYNTHFLQERTEWPAYIEPPMSIIPALPQSTVGNEPTFAYSRFGWKGIVCPQCGRCNVRRRWEEWRCESNGCTFQYQVQQPILTHRAVMDGHEVAFTGQALCIDKSESPVNKRPAEFLGGWRITTFDMLQDNKIVHFHANERVNAVSAGAHDLFRDVQRDTLGLQRFPMNVKMGSGEFLASHFSVNYGMPYKYTVDVDQRSFHNAPQAVLAALHRCEWAANQSLGHGTFQPFNELLAYHDDGETSLGPVIATLSLGGSATMTFKMKDRYYKGLTTSGNYDPTEFVPPGAALYNERLALNQLYGTIPKAQFDTLRRQMYASNRAALKPSPVLVTAHLLHGDIIIMNGAAMQKYYVHKVVSTGKVRFGLTCRHVKKEYVDKEEHWKGDHDPPTETVNYEGSRGTSP